METSAMVGGATYLMDVATSDRRYDPGELVEAMALAYVLAPVAKWLGEGFVEWGGGKPGTVADPGSKGGKGKSSTETTDSTAPKTDGKYPKIEMTEFGKEWDRTHPVKTFTPGQLESSRVVAGPDGKLVFAESGKPVDCTNGIYTMDEAGNQFVIEQPQVGRTHHSTMLKSPSGAGQITSQDGQVLMLDENTGHFGGNQKSGTVKTVANEMASKGVDMSKAEVKPFKK
jgi:hypothetical protein